MPYLGFCDVTSLSGKKSYSKFEIWETFVQIPYRKSAFFCKFEFFHEMEMGEEMKVEVDVEVEVEVEVEVDVEV